MSRFNGLKVAALVAAFGALGCEGWVDPEMPSEETPAMSSGSGPGVMSASLTNGEEIASDADIQTLLDNMNAALATEGAGYRAGWAEYITDAGSGDQAGNTVLAKDVGNQRLSGDFVPNDPRRTDWSGVTAAGEVDNITYAIDQTGDAVPPFPTVGQLTGAQTDAAIVRAMDTWEAVSCSDLGLARNLTTADLGRVAFLNGLGGSGTIAADVQHAGWRDINFPGNILGVTFTFVFVGATGPTDIDGNGQADVAFREIYYDRSFNWRDNGVGNIDVQSVAVHEAGHGLSQAHFGNIALKNDGSLNASPRAVMNALYAAPFRELTGTDNGGHCGNWSAWPNK